MRKRLGFILIFTASACVHGGRGPAATDVPIKVKEPITCAETFDSVFSPKEVQRSFEIGRGVMGEVRRYVENEYPNVVDAFMLHASRLEDCVTDRAVAFYESDIVAKLGYFGARTQMNQTTLAQAILGATPGDAAKWSCFSECSYRRTLTDKIPDCAKNCAMDAKLADFYDNDLALKRLSMSCFQGVTDKTSPELRRVYEKNYLRVMPAFQAKLKEVQPALEAEMVADKRIREKIQALRMNFIGFRAKRTPRTCEAPNFPWVPSAIASDFVIRSKTEEGTAFYLRSGGKRYVAAAVHVTEPNLKLKTQIMLQKILGGQSAGGLRFNLMPDLVSLPNDVIVNPEAAAGPALELAREDEIPQIDQKFMIAGYPAYAGGKFQIVDCTFYGFGPRDPDRRQLEKQIDAAYLLRCPGLGELKGVSGGPMLDEQGRVWGVASFSERFTSTMRAIPFSMGRDGNPKIAIQQTFISDNCYRPFEYRPYKCEVMPKMYIEDAK